MNDFSTVFISIRDSILSLILMAFISFTIYFYPTWIALKKKHRFYNTILLTNLLTGWTVIGWLICYAVALKAQLPVNASYMGDSQGA